jgi:hypothetical protein
MQRSNKVEIRLTDLEKKDWQEAAGGQRLVSSWARAVLNAECARLRAGSEPQPGSRADAPEVTGGPIPAPIPNEKPLIVRAQIEQDASLATKPLAYGANIPVECPRVHHHRAGRYCGTCKKVATKDRA